MSLPPVIVRPVEDEKKDDEKKEPPVLNAKLELNLKKFVICTTRDLKDKDRKLLESYGNVLDYSHDIHNNLSPETFPFDYLLINLNESGDRYFYMKQIKPFRDRYNVVLYKYQFEDDDILDADNIISSFPKRQARKLDFEMILLQERISKPSFWLSLGSCILQTYHQVKK
jgi:hypothetical protein